MRQLVFAAVLFAPMLSACDGATAPVETAAAEPARSSEQVEAQRACSELTGFVEGTVAASETDRLRAQEYAACVDAVLKGAEGPALRGRTDAPA